MSLRVSRKFHSDNGIGNWEENNFYSAQRLLLIRKIIVSIWEKPEAIYRNWQELVGSREKYTNTKLWLGVLIRKKVLRACSMLWHKASGPLRCDILKNIKTESKWPYLDQFHAENISELTVYKQLDQVTCVINTPQQTFYQTLCL